MLQELGNPRYNDKDQLPDHMAFSSEEVTSRSSLIPRPFELRRRKGLVPIACTCTGGPQKKTGKSDIIVYLSVYHPYNCIMISRHPWTGHYGNVTGCHGKASACVCNVYQALSPTK